MTNDEKRKATPEEEQIVILTLHAQIFLKQYEYLNMGPNTEEFIHSLIGYLNTRIYTHEIACLDRQALVDLGYDDKNITDKTIRDIALDINLKQAFASEVGRLAGHYGLVKKSNK